VQKIAEQTEPEVAPAPVAEKPKRTPKPAPKVTPARPGTIEEIEQGPSGKSIAAIFDYDGTMIAGYSALDVAQMRIMRGQVNAREFIGLATLGARGMLGLAGFRELIAFTGANWKGRQERELMIEGEKLFKAKIADRVFPEMKRRLAAHRRKGHTSSWPRPRPNSKSNPPRSISASRMSSARASTRSTGA
jgi:hypothetical protein